MRLILARFCKLAKSLSICSGWHWGAPMLCSWSWTGLETNLFCGDSTWFWSRSSPIGWWCLIVTTIFGFFYNDLLLVVAIEQRRISKGSSPAPHQWRLPPPSSRVSCLAAWTQVLMLMLVIICVFFFASKFVVEIFSHPITVCDLIFSFPGLWLFFEIFSYMKV